VIEGQGRIGALIAAQRLKAKVMKGSGFLAIWSDVEASKETDYLHWLTREHTAERVGIKGFLATRVFRALGTDIRRFFILYELEAPEVLSGPDYLARLNAPTPWSQRIMPILGNFVRGGGGLVSSRGTGQGGVIVAVPLHGASADGAGLVAGLAGLDRIAAVRLFETDQAKTSIETREKGMRAQDRTFTRLLLIEGLDQPAVRTAVNRLASAIPDVGAADGVQLYTFFFGLDRRELR
jgi:hypothetical protein